MSSDTVFVALKYGQGLNIGVVLRGINTDPAPVSPHLGGYAFTAAVPAKVWDLWYAVHHDSDLVERNLILADPDLNALRQKVRKAAGLPMAAPTPINWRDSKPYTGEPHG
jgi:hypothetical protein